MYNTAFYIWYTLSLPSFPWRIYVWYTLPSFPSRNKNYLKTLTLPLPFSRCMYVFHTDPSRTQEFLKSKELWICSYAEFLIPITWTGTTRILWQQRLQEAYGDASLEHSQEIRETLVVSFCSALTSYIQILFSNTGKTPINCSKFSSGQGWSRVPGTGGLSSLGQRWLWEHHTATPVSIGSLRR